MIQSKACNPQVIITDLFLIGVDRSGLTRQIESRWPGKKIIVISVYENEIYRKLALNAGATDFRVIPEFNDDFMSFVKDLLTEKKKNTLRIN